MDVSLIIPIAIAAISIIGLMVIGLTSRRETTSPTGAFPVLPTDDFDSRLNLTPSRRTESNPIPKWETKHESSEPLRERLVQAGLYQRNSRGFFYFLQFVFGAIPFGFGFVAHTMGLVSLRNAFVLSAITGIAGIVTPGLWLDYCKIKRQIKLRRSLPDALDVITVCVEAGLSLTSAMLHVSRELFEAHPMLANEMTIVQREIQMGKSTGQALKNFAGRFDIEELRSLASVVEQSERFGASITVALKVFAESLRVRRMQQAQARAQRAAVKLLFPTIICIFPALLVVILGPAAHDIFETLNDISNR